MTDLQKILSVCDSFDAARGNDLPEIYYRYDECVEVFWISPFDGKEERLFMMMWPGHPTEDTKQVEDWFESYAKTFTISANRSKDLTAALRLAVEALEYYAKGDHVITEGMPKVICYKYYDRCDEPVFIETGDLARETLAKLKGGGK